MGDGTVTTYDIRLKKPNREPVIDVAAMHSLEHIIATYLRNDPDWKDEVIYWGSDPWQTARRCPARRL